jgi:uncharacterized tellurite resistance protein B-like protein
MFFKRSPKPVTPTSSADVLRDLVLAQTRDADEDTQRIVLSVAGLLASVAYADHEYGAAEEAYARDALTRLDGLTPAGVDAICSTLKLHGNKIAAQNPQLYTRELRERTDVELRREVLDVLVDLAAADGELSLAETDVLRRTTSALGLTPDDYLAAQKRHLDKLALLK